MFARDEDPHGLAELGDRDPQRELTRRQGFQPPELARRFARHGRGHAGADRIALRARPLFLFLPIGQFKLRCFLRRQIRPVVQRQIERGRSSTGCCRSAAAALTGSCRQVPSVAPLTTGPA